MTNVAELLNERRNHLSDLDGWNDVEPCYYCGVAAETIDHVLPRFMLQAIAILDDPAIRSYYFRKHRRKTVPACRECNTLIGTRHFDTLAERKEFLKTALRRRYAGLLRTGRWTDAEVDDLGRGLRGYVAGALLDRECLLERLAW